MHQSKLNHALMCRAQGQQSQQGQHESQVLHGRNIPELKKLKFVLTVQSGTKQFLVTTSPMTRGACGHLIGNQHQASTLFRFAQPIKVVTPKLKL